MPLSKSDYAIWKLRHTKREHLILKGWYRFKLLFGVDPALHKTECCWRWPKVWTVVEGGEPVLFRKHGYPKGGYLYTECRKHGLIPLWPYSDNALLGALGRLDSGWKL